MDISPLVYFINEREAIRLRKEVLSLSPPTLSPAQYAAWGDAEWSNALGECSSEWTLDYLTNDPILRKFRFTNIDREQDRVTRWIRENVIERWPTHQYLWTMLAISRTLNWPPTLQHLIDQSAQGVGCWPDSPKFDPARSSAPKQFEGSDLTWALSVWQNAGNKTTTGSYMIRAASSPTEPYFHWKKVRYLAEIVIGRLWEARDRIEGVIDYDGHSSQEVWEYLQQPHFVGWGPFMSGQLVTDLQHTRYLSDAPDIQTWTALGPGSRRGLNRLAGRDLNHPLSQEAGLDEMIEIRERLKKPGVLASWVKLPDLSNVQNCLCETDKMLRVCNGEGRPRALYIPGRGH